MCYNYAVYVFTFMIEIVSTILGENSHDLWLGIWVFIMICLDRVLYKRSSPKFVWRAHILEVSVSSCDGCEYTDINNICIIIEYFLFFSAISFKPRVISFGDPQGQKRFFSFLGWTDFSNFGYNFTYLFLSSSLYCCYSLNKFIFLLIFV